MASKLLEQESQEHALSSLPSSVFMCAMVMMIINHHGHDDQDGHGDHHGHDDHQQQVSKTRMAGLVDWCT